MAPVITQTQSNGQLLNEWANKYVETRPVDDCAVQHCIDALEIVGPIPLLPSVAVTDQSPPIGSNQLPTITSAVTYRSIRLYTDHTFVWGLHPDGFRGAMVGVLSGPSLVHLCSDCHQMTIQACLKPFSGVAMTHAGEQGKTATTGGAVGWGWPGSLSHTQQHLRRDVSLPQLSPNARGQDGVPGQSSAGADGLRRYVRNTGGAPPK